MACGLKADRRVLDRCADSLVTTVPANPARVSKKSRLESVSTVPSINRFRPAIIDIERVQVVEEILKHQAAA
jgi:hypothetical protein